MKIHDLVKVTDERLLNFFQHLIKSDTVGKVIELVEEKNGVDYYKVRFGKYDYLLADKECEVVYDEKDRKYSYDMWKQYMLKRHDDLMVALLINMGGGDSYNDGKTAEYMREHGRIVIPEWYYYDTDLI
jgi:hypothetical protein